jgi:hypothetical protein
MKWTRINGTTRKDLKTLQLMPKVSIIKSVTSHMTIAAQPQAQIKEI